MALSLPACVVVSELPEDLQEDVFIGIVGKFEGFVKARIRTGRRHRHRVGFIDFLDLPRAQAALNALNRDCESLFGKVVHATLSNNSTPSGEASTSHSGNSDAPIVGASIVVSELPLNMTEETFVEVAATLKGFVAARIRTARQDRHRIGFVDFALPEDAAHAVDHLNSRAILFKGKAVRANVSNAPRSTTPQGQSLNNSRNTPPSPLVVDQQIFLGAAQAQSPHNSSAPMQQQVHAPGIPQPAVVPMVTMQQPVMMAPTPAVMFMPQPGMMAQPSMLPAGQAPGFTQNASALPQQQRWLAISGYPPGSDVSMLSQLLMPYPGFISVFLNNEGTPICGFQSQEAAFAAVSQLTGRQLSQTSLTPTGLQFGWL